MKLRVATWNVHSCVGSDGRCDPARVAEVIASLEADVVGLQEVDSRGSRTGGVAQLEAFAERIGGHRIAGPNLFEADGDFGNALLTPHPIECFERVDVSVPEVEPRGLIDATIAVRGSRLRVLVTHLGLRAGERATQLLRIRERLVASPGGATALVGDFNEWRPRPFANLGALRGHLRTSARPRSFPSRLPLFSLDRILVDPSASTLEVRVIRSGEARLASDHLPVVADLEWRETAQSVG